MPAIHQFVAGYTHGDAISNEARIFRNLFTARGHEATIVSETRRILPELRRDACDAHEARRTIQKDDLAILHLSIGSPLNDMFAELPCRKVILYHNITPPHYFRVVNPATAHLLARGRQQLERLAGCADLTLADSRFNASELEELGFQNVDVLPLVIDLDALSARVDRRTRRRLEDGRVNVVFVGRCAPNKRIEDALKVFAIYNRTANPLSRFVHVGSYAGTERYYYLLLSMLKDMGLQCVDFLGSLPQPQLNAVFDAADVFLCMSEHEGFCIPILESMACDVPVVACANAAVPETMDGAGILLHERDFPLAAELLHEIVSNDRLRNAIVAGQRHRIERYRALNPAARLLELLQPLLPPPP